MSLVRFENVKKAFGDQKVLDGLSFDVEKGEVLALVGPSGTGKSVTLKHIVRLLAPDSGRVFVDGVDVSDCSARELKAIRRRVGYLFQGGALLAWMTVQENVALPLKECTNLTDEEIDSRVAKALAEVDLSEAADKYPAEISGGMQKRAGLARAIVRDSDVILYDEPTSGLDPVTSITIHRLIKKLNTDLGITSIVVTHDLQGALNFADRIMLIKEGRMVECSAPAQFAASVNPVVREFLTAMKGEL